MSTFENNTTYISTAWNIHSWNIHKTVRAHLDIIILSISEGYRYCLTCIDRFTRWSEIIPLENQEETVAKAFYFGWIARFGVPLRITTDQGRQFEFQLFKQLNMLTGSKHLHTMAYHPQANDLVERFHPQLKVALRCHDNNRWTEHAYHPSGHPRSLARGPGCNNGRVDTWRNASAIRTILERPTHSHEGRHCTSNYNATSSV